MGKLLASAWNAVLRFLTISTRGKRSSVQMDPHLVRASRRTPKYGIRKVATSSTGEGEMAVIARVTDLEMFNKRTGRDIKSGIKGDGDEIVIARIPADENYVESLRHEPCVKSLKAATRIRPLAEPLSAETLGSIESFVREKPRNGGKGVIVGIVDFGLDVGHRNFRNDDGSTRILALWDQKAAPGGKSPERFGYGRLFERDEINEALGAPDPGKALGYDLPKGDLFEAGAHGTYVADVAAGNGLGSGRAGVAAEAEIVFVDLATCGLTSQGAQAVGGSFGDSVQLLEAVQFIFDYANDRPCVVNISLGTNGGPHDGTTLVEEAIDRLVSQKPNRAVVIAAGNFFGESLHAMGAVPEGGSIDVKWRIPRYDPTSNQLELWYAGTDRFSIDVLDPRGKRVARVKPGHTWKKTRYSKGLMTIVNRLDDPNNHDNVITVFFERGLPAGEWTLRLRGDSVEDGRFHAWIERDESGQSRFVRPKDNSYTVSDQYTLSSIACGRKSIVVSSFDANEDDLPLADTSSSGPTRDQDYGARPRDRNERQPTLSAPGESVLAAQSGTVVRVHRASGTSIAAAAVTGAVALVMSDAAETGSPLKAERIRDIMIDQARRCPPDNSTWDPGMGNGRIRATTSETIAGERNANLAKASAATGGAVASDDE
jgi:hypothetical protein